MTVLFQKKTFFFLFFLVVCLLSSAAEKPEPFAKKGKLILSDNFSQPIFSNKKNEPWGNGSKRRGVFGQWTSLGEGTVQVENIVEQGHGPVVSYWKPLKNLIVECEFKLPEDDVAGRHFRIFLDQHSKGHTIAAWANVSFSKRPLGVTLLHYPKAAEKNQSKVNFGTLEHSELTGKWIKMRLEVLGEKVRLTVGDRVIEGELSAIAGVKKNVALNVGSAGGQLRHFRVWEALLLKAE